MKVPSWATVGTLPAKASIWAFVLYSLYQGCGIVLGGDVRWGGPAYTFLRGAPGAPESWGWALCVLGITLAAASAMENWWLKLVALVGIASWSFGFAIGAHLATFNVDNAGTTGGPAYLLITFLAAGLILPDEARKVT